MSNATTERLAFRLSSGQLAVIKRDGTGLTPVSPIGAEVSSWDWPPSCP